MLVRCTSFLGPCEVNAWKESYQRSCLRNYHCLIGRGTSTAVTHGNIVKLEAYGRKFFEYIDKLPIKINLYLEELIRC